jgi:xylan 1,4-beta-xylosidase
MEKGKAIPTVVRPENWKADVAGITPQTFTGNFRWRDDFNTDEKLALEWLFIRTPRENWWSIHEGKLHLTPTAFDIYTVGAPAFIGHRQQHTNFTVTTEMSFTPLNEQTFAGLVCYQNEKFNLIFGKTIRKGKQVITVVRTDNGKQTTEGTFTLEDKRTDLPLYLRITGRGGKYSFTLSFDKKKWQEVVNDLDATILSTHKAGGFTGTIIGMYTGK